MRDMAAKLDCVHSHVAKIETNEQPITLNEFIAWCQILESNPVEVLGRITEHQTEEEPRMVAEDRKIYGIES